MGMNPLVTVWLPPKSTTQTAKTQVSIHFGSTLTKATILVPLLQWPLFWSHFNKCHYFGPTLSNEQHLGVISTFVFNCNTIHGKVELKLAKSKVAIGFLIWCLRFENKYSVSSHPGYPVPVIQSVLQGRVYHRFGIFWNGDQILIFK